MARPHFGCSSSATRSAAETRSPITTHHRGAGELDAALSVRRPRHGGRPDGRAGARAPQCGEPQHLTVKGRNYRLFSVGLRGHGRQRPRARARPARKNATSNSAASRSFPIDNYAPIGVQEELIKYWFAHGRPAEIASRAVGSDSHLVACATHADSHGLLKLILRLSIFWQSTASSGDARPRGSTRGQRPSRGVDDMGRRACRSRPSGRPGARVAASMPSFGRGRGTSGRPGQVDDARRRPFSAGTFALIGATVITGTDAPPIRERDDRDPRRPHRGDRSGGVHAGAERRPVGRRRRA